MENSRLLIVSLIGAIIAGSAWYAIAAEEEAPAMHSNPVQSDPHEELMRHRNEGAAHFESGILKKALASFIEASKLKKDSLAEAYNLALVYRKQGEVAEARRLLAEAIKLDPDFPNSYYVKGLIDKQEGKTDAAIASFKMALEKAPNDSSPYYQLGLLLRDKGEDQAALQSMVHALQIDPYHTGALYQLYQSYHQAGEIDKAKLTMKEFSRIKKSVSRSRKQLSDEESALSVPLASDRSSVKSGAVSNKFKVSLDASPITLPGAVSAFALHDVDGDTKAEIVAVSDKGAVWLVSGSKAGAGKLEHKALGTINGLSGVKALLVERFAVDEEPRLVIASAQGLAISAPGFVSTLGDVEWLSKTPQAAIRTIDIDHDGDLDLLSLASGAVYVNRGDGRFTEKAGYLGEDVIKLAMNDASEIIGGDFINRIGVDLVVRSSSGSRYFLQDATGGRYNLRKDVLPAIADVSWIAKGDLNNDGLMDLVGAGSDKVFADINLGEFSFSSTSIGDHADGKTAKALNGAVADYDNDGREDVLIFLDGGKIVLWRNQGKEGFARHEVPAQKDVSSRQPVVATDLDGDGGIDVIALSDQGQIITWWNRSEGLGSWMKLDLAGMRSPPSGQMTQVEVRRGSWYSKYESAGLPLQIGLGDADYVEILRISWPNGFVESKFKVDEHGPWRFEESERVSGSCPSVFAWNGDSFQFITDAFISGPMGVPVSSDKYFPVDHDEYVKIPGESLKRNGDRYQVRITEELREAVFLDQVELLVIDHPDGTDIYPNERLAPPPFPEFGVHETRYAKPSPQVIDHRNNDVTDLVAAVDDTYPSSIARSRYTGFSEPQGITVTLPKGAASSRNLRLFLTGWFYYFDSTSMISASQHTDMNIIWPQVQIRQDGQWKTISYTGIPSGKGKTVVVDLSGKLPQGASEVRVWTNVELYWDQVLIDTTDIPKPAHDVQRAPLLSADLRFRGFSHLLEKQGPQPDRFDYNRVSYTALWNPLKGDYTRYGDVEPLLGAEDSQMVVFGSGDELVLEFAAPDEDGAPGRKRDFFLYLNGFVKDGDKYTAHAGTTGPVPFVGMPRYPYDESEDGPTPFSTTEYKDYLKQYQTRKPLRFTGPALSVMNDTGQ